jgi:hypothetical protein
MNLEGLHQVADSVRARDDVSVTSVRRMADRSGFQPYFETAAFQVPRGREQARRAPEMDWAHLDDRAGTLVLYDPIVVLHGGITSRCDFQQM